MDSIAYLIAHYFLNFFHLIGMDSFVRLFGEGAFNCAFFKIEHNHTCYNQVWLGYTILVIVIVAVAYKFKK